MTRLQALDAIDAARTERDALAVEEAIAAGEGRLDVIVLLREQDAALEARVEALVTSLVSDALGMLWS